MKCDVINGQQYIANILLQISNVIKSDIESMGTDSANPVESDLRCTSRIYLDNAMPVQANKMELFHT